MNGMHRSNVSDAGCAILRSLMEDEDIARALRAAPTPTIRRYRDRFELADFQKLIALGRNALVVLEKSEPNTCKHETSARADDNDARSYSIRGRIELAGAAMQTVAGLVVELWEQNASSTTPRASALTDSAGGFEVLLHDRDLTTASREIYFRVSNGGAYLLPNPPETWRPTDAPMRIVLLISGTHVAGYLRNQDGSPVAGYTINALASQMRTEDLLGTTVTDVTGYYSIDFAFPSPKLDLRVRAVSPGGIDVADAAVVTNVGQNVEVDLVIGNTPLAGTSEYGTLLAAINFASAGIPITTLLDTDVAALASKFGLSQGLIQLVVDANVAAASLPTSGLSPELFYAIGHTRQHATVSSSLAISPDDRLSAVNRAVASGLVSSSFAAIATAQLTTLEGMRTSLSLVDPPTSLSTRLAMILAISGMTSTSDQQTFLTAYLGYSGSLADFWANAPSLTGLSSGVLTNAQNALGLGIYTLNHPPMVQSLWAGGIQTASALAQQSAASLVTRAATSVTIPLPGGGSTSSMTVGVPGELATGSSTDYANAILTAVSRAYPSSVFRAAYVANPISGTTTSGASVATFLSANASFDFLSTSVSAYVRANPGAFTGNTAAQPLVEKMARLFKIAPEPTRYATVQALWTAGFESARSIYLFGKAPFIARMTAAPYSLTTAAATSLYNKAAHTNALASAIAMKYGASFQAPGAGGAINQLGFDSAGVASPPASIPDWADMFGSLDYCQCDDCSSVLSAAAYLTDLYHFLEQRPSAATPTMLQTLRARRADLTKIQLSCSNTNTELPSIDITNEALELRVHPTALTAPAVSPDTIEGLVGWWRADNMTVNGTSHIIAADLSRNGNTLTSSSTTLTLAPQSSANGQLGLVCDGSGTLVGSTFFSGTADPECTFVCIGQTTLTTGPRFFWANGGIGSSAAGYGYVINDGGSSVRANYDSVNGALPTDGEPLTTALELTAWVGHNTGATAGNRELWVNGIQHTLSATNYALPSAANDGFFLGGWTASSSDAMQGVVYEMLVFNRALTHREIQGLTSYAHNRYGTGLPLTTWTPAYQTTWSEDDLAAHPENLLTAAYDDLAEAIYPWSMPYAFALDEARAYVGLKSVARAEICAAALIDPYSNAPWAKEILGLSDLQEQVIQGSGSLISSFTAPEYWGVLSPPATWYSGLAAVPALLTASGLDYDDASAIVSTTYVTASVSPPIVIDLHGGCDTAAATLDNLDLSGTASAPFFDRFHRFARLQASQGWTIRQTDRAVMNLGGGALNASIMAPLAYAKEIVRRTNATLDTVLTWRAGTAIDTAPDPATGISPFEKLFPPKGTSTSPSPFLLNVQRTALADESKPLANYYVALAGGLGTDAVSIEDIVTYESLGSANLTLVNISTLFRYVTLAKALKLSVSSLLVLLTLTGRTPFSPSTVDHGIRLLDDATDAKSYALSPELIQYVLWHVDTTVATSTTVSCTVVMDSTFAGAAAATLDSNGNVTVAGQLVASIQGFPQMLFTNRDTVASGAGTHTVTFVSMLSGAVACSAGTLTVIMPTTGWTSIVNATAIVGVDSVETPSDTTIQAFLSTLQTALVAVTPAALDASGGVTETYLETFYAPTATPSDAETAFAIVAGTSGMSESDQDTWIDAHGWSAFLDTTDAKAKLVTSGGTLSGADARFGYFQPLIQVFIDKQTLVVSRVASTFKITNTTSDGILRTYMHARTTSGALDSTMTPLTLLTALGTPNSVPATLTGAVDITSSSLYGGGGTLNGTTLTLNINGAGATSLVLNGATNAANEAALLTAILVQWPTLASAVAGGPGGKKLVLTTTATGNTASIVVTTTTASTALGIGGTALGTGVLALAGIPAHWYTYLHLQKVGAIVSHLKLADTDLPWAFAASPPAPISVDALPVVTTMTSGAFFKLTHLVHAATARAPFAGGALFDIFAANASYASLDDVLTDISNRTGWGLPDLEAVAANITPALTLADFVDGRPVVRLETAIGIVQRLGLAAATIFPQWADVTFPATASDSQALKDDIRGTFSGDSWTSVVKPARNSLRERQRDALVSYLLGAPGVLPIQIPGLVCWLRADMGVTLDGSNNVMAWADQSGCGNTFTQATAANRPAYSATEPAYFSSSHGGGSSDMTRLVGSIAGITNAQTYIAVFTPTATEGYVATKSATAESIIDSDGSHTIQWSNPSDAASFTTSSTYSAPTIVTAAQTDGVNTKLYYNGTQVASFTPAAASASIDSIMGTSGGNAMGGRLYELIVFNRQLTADELTDVHAYLAARYGITLATSPTARRYTDSDDLSADVLLDVEQQSCALTSRIVQASASTQTFLTRILLNLEAGYSLSTDDARQWQWMKAYRIWQANREVFLYPENWLDPSLRDDTTPLFQNLQTDLSQGALTDDSIEVALLNYLKGLDEIAHLDVVASADDTDPDTGINTFHVVARTRAHPPVYYYRTRTTGMWSPWTNVDIDIQSDHTILAIYNRRPYLIWANVTQSSRTKDQTFSQTTTNAPTKLFQIRLRWTSLRRGKWGKAQQSVAWIPDESLMLLPAELRFETQDMSGNGSDGSSPTPAELMRKALDALAFRFSIDSTTDDLHDLRVTVINSDRVDVTPS